MQIEARRNCPASPAKQQNSRPDRHKKRCSKHKEKAIESPQKRVEEYGKDEAPPDKKQDNQPNHPHPVIELHRPIRQKVPQNMASIQWRNGDQVEDEQQKVDKYHKIKK